MNKIKDIDDDLFVINDIHIYLDRCCIDKNCRQKIVIFEKKKSPDEFFLLKLFLWFIN